MGKRQNIKGNLPNGQTEYTKREFIEKCYGLICTLCYNRLKFHAGKEVVEDCIQYMCLTILRSKYKDNDKRNYKLWVCIVNRRAGDFYKKELKYRNRNIQAGLFLDDNEDDSQDFGAIKEELEDEEEEGIDEWP